VVKMG